MNERENHTHTKDAFLSFHEMTKDRRYCDFTLQIGEEEIPVHRIVLAACSKYFDAMFQSKMKETETGFVEILGIEPSAGKQCLEYIYTGKVKFSQENPKDLIHAAELMELHGLVDLYFEYLAENITSENCLKYIELAVTYSRASFSKIFEKFFAENFAKIIKADDFTKMTLTLLTQCIGCIASSSRYSEELKFQAVKTWVNADIENREKSFLELFRLVKLESLSVRFLKETVGTDKLVSGSDECEFEIYKALKKIDNFLNNQVVDEDPPTHVLAYKEDSGFLLKYDLSTKSWCRLIRVSKPLITGNMKIFCYQGEIYLVSASGLTKLADGIWTKILDTGVDDGFCRIAAHGNVIFLVANAFHYEYNLKSNSSVKYDIPVELRLGNGFAIAVSDEFLYAMGGYGSERSAIEYAFATRTWGSISKMNESRIECSALFFKGKLIAIGGGVWLRREFSCSYSKGVEYYEPSFDKWINLPKQEGKNSFIGSNFEAYLHNGRLFTLGNTSKIIKELKLEFGKPGNEQAQIFFSKACVARLT